MLIASGFYDGLQFHRIIPGFIAQGGDPTGIGNGGSGKTLEAEFNERTHTVGTVAMARGHDPNSADSQFYISMATLPQLDRQYTVIGQVTEGIEFVPLLIKGDTMDRVTIQ